jgi:hypothetical protein
MLKRASTTLIEPVMNNEQNQLERDAFALITSSSVNIKALKAAIENLIASKSSRITLQVVKSKSEVWSTDAPALARAKNLLQNNGTLTTLVNGNASNSEVFYRHV